nr:hypothetical protein [Tanacetum cinerariifolium]
VLLKLILPVHRIRRWRYNLTPAESKFNTSMLDHQDKHMMKAQVHVSKSFAISDVQTLPQKKLYRQNVEAYVEGEIGEIVSRDFIKEMVIQYSRALFKDGEEEFPFVNKYPSFQEEPIVLVEEESEPIYDRDNEEEESMLVYDTAIKDVIEEEEGFVLKGGFGLGGKEDNIEDIVVLTPGKHIVCRFAGRGNEPDPRDVKIASLKQRIQEDHI